MAASLTNILIHTNNYSERKQTDRTAESKRVYERSVICAAARSAANSDHVSNNYITTFAVLTIERP